MAYSYVFNPFTGNFDVVPSASSASQTPMRYSVPDGETYLVADTYDVPSSMFKFWDGLVTIDGFVSDVL